MTVNDNDTLKQYAQCLCVTISGNHEICKNEFLKAGIAQAISNPENIALFHLRMNTLSLIWTQNSYS